MHRAAVVVQKLNDNVESWRSLSLEDRLLRAAALGFGIAQSNRLDATDEIGEGRVKHQILERLSVGRADQLNASLCDSAARERLRLGANFVDYDDFRHVVLHRLDHHIVLFGRRSNLHPSGVSNARVRDVTITRNFV